jgi:hypothetical protein
MTPLLCSRFECRSSIEGMRWSAWFCVAGQPHAQLDIKKLQWISIRPPKEIERGLATVWLGEELLKRAGEAQNVQKWVQVVLSSSWRSCWKGTRERTWICFTERFLL